MQSFARLCEELDSSTRTTDHVEALARYFQTADPADAAWAVWFLCGNRPRRVVSVRQLQQWCAELVGLPEWLLETCREFVGDLAETLALLLPVPASPSPEPLRFWVEERLLPLATQSADERRRMICGAWQALTQRQRFVFNKLLTGGFRIGVSRKLVVRSLSRCSGVPAEVLTHRLMGSWQPTPAFFTGLLSAETADTDISRPYPFCLANPLPPDVSTELSGLASADRSLRLGAIDDWVVEWKWDGIRAQLIRRSGQTFLWSRGEELMEGRFPEIEQSAADLPDGCVLDGEVLAWKDGRVQPFSELQKRISRRRVSRRLVAQIPVQFLAFDLLEEHGQDIRILGTAERRGRLARLLSVAGAENAIRQAPQVSCRSWSDCADQFRSARERHVEGLMLKRSDAACEPGRPVGVWWKWKSEPLHCDAVLLYAQRGHGRRAGRYTDFTFAVRDGDQFVPFAKAYSGLTKDEIEEVDRFIREHTIERFGPVTSVQPQLVFELAFEGIQISSRHRSGIAVRFPRITRWRRDKTAQQIDTLETLKTLAASLPRPQEQPQALPPKATRIRKKKSPGSDPERPSSPPPERLGGLFAGLDDDDDA
ncbi:MAG: ATP-dependent DNA ligase [Planctomycetota bacterium]